MTVSIIIAAKTWQKDLEECISKCQGLDFTDFEILVLPDEPLGSGCPLMENGGLSIFPTGPVRPAEKRDMAIKCAKGEVIAFIDDDAYPAKDWLKNALENFKDQTIAAVGGPAVTCPEDNLRQKASGIVYQSTLVSARFNYRYIPKEKREVDDFPSCNFLVRKSILQELGGFNTDFWPGEDTKLCFDITQKLGKKIIYDPKVFVWHHRRPLIIAHLRQVARYGVHRGYFAKRYPETSRKLSYFVPSIFLFFLIIGGILAISSAPIRQVYLLGLSLYFLLVFIFSISNGLSLFFLVFPGIILTHLAYGVYFLKGIISRKLKEEL